MTDQEKISRTLRLLLMLAGNRKYTRAQIAERIGVEERTVYRYLNTFENAGFVVEQKEGAYSLLTNNDPAKTLGKLFHFSEEEAYILYQALDQVKISNTLKERLVHKLHALYDFKVLAAIGSDKSIENIGLLKEAMNSKKEVLLKAYRSSNSRTIADRQVEPFGFLPDYEAVWCYDLKQKQNKVFRISRIHSVTILPDSWRYESFHAMPFSDAFRMSAPEPIATVTAVLSLKGWNLLREEYPLAAQYVQPKDGTYLLQISVADFGGIGRFILGLASDVHVLGPEAFKEFLREKIKFFGG